MDTSTLEAVVAAGGIVSAALVGGGASHLLRVRSQNTNDDANSAQVLAKAYSLLVDDLQKASVRQDQELKALREELRRVVTNKDGEIAGLRHELAQERAESGRLRDRVVDLERTVRRLTHPNQK